MFIVDAHLDIAYNAVNYGRDPRRSVAGIRAAETGASARGQATVALPELQQAGVGLIFGTLFVPPADAPVAVFEPGIAYRDAAEAHRHAMTQLDYYHRLADERDDVRLVRTIAALDEVIASHQASDSPQKPPLLGVLLLMEGADPIREPEAAEAWYEHGLRAIGLAWDDTRYSPGNWRGNQGGLTKEGRRLLEVMADLGFLLDLSHMSEKATLETLDQYEGAVMASHSNARALVPGTRQLSDTQIRHLGEREGVIGIVLYNAFLRAHYRKGDPKESVTLQHVVGHIDHVCQTLGDALHVGIGSDMDGGFGAADIPAEMDSVADLPLIAGALRARGYEEADIANIMGRNWLRLLRTTLP